MKKSRWKIAFFSLLVLNILIVGLLSYFIFSPGVNEIPKYNVKESDKINLKVKSNKKDLTNLINHYIQKENLNGPIDYSVNLDNEVELFGTMQIFSEDVQLKMTFEPVALKNGDLLLKQKSILIGDLNLPVSYVLKFIQKSYKLPEWVTIVPNEEVIYVGLHDLKVNNMTVRANTFDLENDDIEFSLQVPMN
ncbi:MULTISPECIES: YpmS family protein [Heyndrickxia]|jgi:uncharacterized protein YpmS|uniref:YpmS family protein n=1 Tax=Heyndrickxia oleronia TaxID=38875 RepID=A0AAW6SUT1_9BACI|nr:YpmS family protein [Heyndrickxia oleronia]NYV65390.1 YpmS family protein [Bacillus sp. Gen3]OJH19781.1 hypothetical protein BLX88_06260 [Bacillus obstructivus]MBU5210039.1 YpmS family protein [Heyndrickxia oleronia]MCI1593431.1 YpmS family protein [Heyndrickxia oleronia]MCI1615250.1 YpmS family protein [Heyndrickxia oleronia]